MCIFYTVTISKNNRAQLFLPLNEEIYVTKYIFFALKLYVMWRLLVDTLAKKLAVANG